jgi:hypothetical protein
MNLKSSFSRSLALFILIFAFVLTIPTFAQTSTITASVSESGARFAAADKVLEIQLQIYAASGELIFDSGARRAGIFDWKLSDAHRSVADGTYLSVVTVKDLRERVNQRLCFISVKDGRLSSIAQASEQDITSAQTASLASKRETLNLKLEDKYGAVTILNSGKEPAVTVTAHDGEAGQVTSTHGALTFRTGDFFSNKEREQMRITPEGLVGIGTDKPETALDVAGTIRARGGIQFDDGTVLKSASGVFNVDNRKSDAADSSLSPDASGVGTQNRIAKWGDNTGTLVNSSLSEDVAGNIGIGTTTPGGVFDLQHSSSTDILQRFWNTGNGGAKLRYVAGKGNVSQLQLTDADEWLMSIAGNNTIGMQFRVRDINSVNSEASLDSSARMTILRNGNVGVGTTAPTNKLEVAGNLKLSGAGNGLIFPDGTKMTTALGGGSMTGTNIVSAINDPATTGAINDNRLSFNIARLNGANLWSGSNVFNAGLSANNALITNVGNPVNAGDATNKAYVDANFVKFVPGTEQLSVGDANGTAPMINLRGGSTCCSGPGGHTPAWFKVFQNGSFVATGNLGIGVSPMQGKGYRTSWDSYKGAFRSGYADNEWDDATVGFFSWAGGSNSTAEGLYAFAFGDTNFARSTSSIAFGSGNEVKGAAGFSAGAGNRVCDTYGVAFGNKAQSGGPLINGKCDPDTFNIRGEAAVAIGWNVTADQDHTTAMGKFATNNGFAGTFIWSDGSATASADTFRNTANNEFAARASGGFRFRTNLGGTTGCNLPAGSGVFNCTSSRYTKENFRLVNGSDVLSKLRNIQLSTWNYITEGQTVRHLGPMAEDFHAAFGLGTDDKSIGVQDLGGVSLAAVKALDAELQKKNSEVETLKAEVNSLQQRLAALEQTVQKLAREQK